MNVALRTATASDASELTRIAFASKRYWNYPESCFEGEWKRELTIDEAYIANATVIFIAQTPTAIAGYCTVTHEPNDRVVQGIDVAAGHYIDHMFIDPPFIGKRIGSLLIDTVLDYAKRQGYPRLRLYADPNARGFYEKIGASFVCDSPSSIPGRNIPVMEFELWLCHNTRLI